MGGGYYDRTVYTSITSSSSSSFSKKSSGYSTSSDNVFKVQSKSKTLHKSVDPKRFKDSQLTTKHKNPIIFSVDVTGSMGNWTKIIYDKLPMFYGQLMMNGYLPDPSLCFTAIGDAKCDKASVQICDFGQGKQIDQLISKLWLEKGGGGSYAESYELTAFFLLHKLKLQSNCETPFCFFTGDESFYKKVNKNEIKSVLGMHNVNNTYSSDNGGDGEGIFSKIKSVLGWGEETNVVNVNGYDVNSYNVFKKLKKKFKGNLYLLHVPYGNKRSEKLILEDWKKAIGSENVIHMENGKSVIDIALGIIAIATRERSLDEYLQDLRNRNQTKERISEVKRALQHLSKKFKAKKIENKLVKKINAIAHGIIPIRINSNKKAEVFIAKHAKFKHWDFIKGMPNSQNEDGKKCAERRLKEESGLTVLEYVTPKTFKTKYQITNWTGYKVDKKVYWYLCEVDGVEKICKSEISDAKWVPIENVCDLLTYDNGKELFKEAMPYIEKRLKVE